MGSEFFCASSLGAHLDPATNEGTRRRSAGLRPGVSGARPCRGAGPEVGAPEAVTRRASSLVSLAILLLSILQVLAGPPFVGAPEPAKPPKDSPLTAEEELAAAAQPPETPSLAVEEKR